MQAEARGEAPRVAQELGIANFNVMQAEARGEAPRVAQELGITKSLSHEMLIYQKNITESLCCTTPCFTTAPFMLCHVMVPHCITLRKFWGSTLENNLIIHWRQTSKRERNRKQNDEVT